MLRYEILVDRAERPQKCTILPLEGRPDLTIRRFARGKPIAPLEGDLFLHMDGAPLCDMTSLAETKCLALVDCQWKRVPHIVAQIALPLPRLARIPDGFVTAYPRRNKDDLDPTDGLATIEAVFIAAAFCGVWDESLFARYHFGAAFLAANREVFARFGLGPR